MVDARDLRLGVKALRVAGWMAIVLVAAYFCWGSSATARSKAPVQLITDFRQAANDETAGPVTGYGHVHWVSSILQSNNSLYVEDWSVPQRFICINIPASAQHFLDFSMQFTKGGVHAYDFLDSWGNAKATAQSEGLMYLALNPSGPDIGPPSDLGAIADSLRTGTIANKRRIDVPCPGDSFLSKDGSTQARIDLYTQRYNFTRKIRLFSNVRLSSAYFEPPVHSVPNLQDTGNSFVSYRLRWEVDPLDTNVPNQQVFVELAGHLAKSVYSTGEVVWGNQLGSAFTGGGFKFSIDNFDGASVSQANQIRDVIDELLPSTQVSVTATIVLEDFLGPVVRRPITFTLFVGSEVAYISDSVNLNPGVYSFYSPFVGTFDIAATAPMHLRRMERNVVISLNAFMTFQPMANGDLNGDNRIDSRDLKLVNDALRRHDLAGDVDGDGDVDFADVGIVKRNSGKVGD